MTTQPGDSYASRFPYVVPHSLDDLTGPRHGSVTWPRGDRRTYDLDDADAQHAFYEHVLVDAATVTELCSALNKDLLLALWPQLRPPRYCVRRWHDTFPELATPGSGGIWQ
ncbi:hypothetical protein OG474_07715 [Kribbella sp. NBC_01505]|uniref:hypothetical protein n=1 Tax=Kribbella sp. NBC_01505 TaxID=2903580 RepID=UPI0038675D3F